MDQPLQEQVPDGTRRICAGCKRTVIRLRSRNGWIHDDTRSVYCHTTGTDQARPLDLDAEISVDVSEAVEQLDELAETLDPGALNDPPAICGELIPYPREGSGRCERVHGHRGMHRRGLAAIESDESDAARPPGSSPARPTYAEQDPVYRQSMIDAGRGHLLP